MWVPCAVCAVSILTHTHTYTHTHKCTHMCTHTHAHTHMHTTHIHTHTRAHTHTPHLLFCPTPSATASTVNYQWNAKSVVCMGGRKSDHQEVIGGRENPILFHILEITKRIDWPAGLGCPMSRCTRIMHSVCDYCRVHPPMPPYCRVHPPMPPYCRVHIAYAPILQGTHSLCPHIAGYT